MNYNVFTRMVRINTFIVIRCLNTIVSATSIIACMRDRKGKIEKTDRCKNVKWDLII